MLADIEGSELEPLVYCALAGGFVALLIWAVCELWLKQPWARPVAAISFVVVFILCLL